jgi:hypothetical protein
VNEEKTEPTTWKTFPTIWEVLHDGSIVTASGTVPGKVLLDVSIDYLRERFSDSGKTIRLTLIGCTRFAYRDFNAGEEFVTDLSAIAAMEPEVLNAETRDGLSIIDCAGGILEVAAADALIALDSGRSITLQELLDVSEAYWTEWKDKAERARQQQ